MRAYVCAYGGWGGVEEIERGGCVDVCVCGGGRGCMDVCLAVK